jgi:hypothetical protein
VLGARGKLVALAGSDKAVTRLLKRKRPLFATKDFSTFPQCLWDLLWTPQREDRAFSNLT